MERDLGWERWDSPTAVILSLPSTSVTGAYRLNMYLLNEQAQELLVIFTIEWESLEGRAWALAIWGA